LESKLAKFLLDRGYESPEVLDKKVQEVLKGTALEEYLKVKKDLDKKSQIGVSILQICGIIAVVSGVFLGALVLLGIMTGGLALSVLGVISLAGGVIAIVVAFIAVIQADQEREDLQKCIKDLSFERVKVRKAMMEMSAINTWLFEIEEWLTDPNFDPQRLEKKFQKTLKADLDKAEISRVVSELRERDNLRGSWTKEDPQQSQLVIQVPVAKVGVAAAVNPIGASASGSVNTGNGFFAQVSDPDEEVKKEVGKRGIFATVARETKSEGLSDPITLEITDFGKNFCTGTDEKGCQWSLETSTISQVKNASKTALDWAGYQFSLVKLDTGVDYSGFQIVSLDRTG